MPDSEKPLSPEQDVLPSPSGPLVFISHDSRDGELAEALSKLLKSVSAGMIKTFRSSDKKGKEGIDFGDEWYKRLMSKLQATSDVVCLFTERSLNRPWILFEAGVAKGKLDTPVIGLALGVPLNRVSAGPFYQFHNMDDSESDLIKLVNQLADRVPGLEIDADVIKAQVAAFKETEAAILEKLTTGGVKKDAEEKTEDSSVAKLVEEMKALPSRVAERLAESGEPFRKRRRRLHPMMFDEIAHIASERGDPVGILMLASLARDDAPWLYELAMEAYKAVKSGDVDAIKQEIERLHSFGEFAFGGRFMEGFGIGERDAHIFLMEFPRMLDHLLRRTLAHQARRNIPARKRKPSSK